MGCMQPHTSGGWVSPGYPPPIMLLDTDIKEIKDEKEKETIAAKQEVKMLKTDRNNDLTAFQDQVFTISGQLEDVQMEYDRYKEQIENNARPTVPQMTQTSVLGIDDDSN